MKNPVKGLGAMREWSLLNAGSLSTALVYALFGLALLIAPNTSGRIFGYGLALLLAVAGGYCVYSYLRSDRMSAFVRQDLTLGLALLAGGGLLFAMPGVPAGILPYVWGGALILGGFGKVQLALDLRRWEMGHWWHCLIGAAVALTLGVVALCNPFGTEMVLIRFMGAGLMADGLMDVYCWYVVSRLRKGK